MLTRHRFCLLVAAVGVAACSSSTAPLAEGPDGLSVTLNDVVVARTLGGTTEGGIHVHFGEYSGLFIVDVLDSRGRTLALDPDHRLEAVVGDVGIAAFIQPSPGAFRGEFEMYGDGTTSITFRLMRVGSDVPEWTSPRLELVVVTC